MEKRVTVLCCEGKSIISKGIKLFTKSHITHTAFKIIINGKEFIAESQVNGFALKTIETWKEQFGYKYHEFEIPDNYNQDLLESKIFDKLSNVPYDFRLFILRYPKKIISQLFTKKKDKPNAIKNEEDRQTCSESVADVLGWGEPQSYLPIGIYDRCKTEKFKLVNR